MAALDGFQILSMAANVPGPVAAARLRDFGARVIKVEGPAGDPLAKYCPEWYGQLCEGMEVRTLDLKIPSDKIEFEQMLGESDLLLTANRPAALARLGLGWDALHARFPRLCQVAIVGYPPPRENVPGHDLNYQASAGSLTPPHMPRVLMADMAGAERAVSAAFALLMARERGAPAGHAYVALSEAVEAFAVTVRHGITTPHGVLGGAAPNYTLYRTRSGYLAAGVLEPHFFAALLAEFGLTTASEETLAALFSEKTAVEWEAWALVRDLPLTAVRESGDTSLKMEKEA